MDDYSVVDQNDINYNVLIKSATFYDLELIDDTGNFGIDRKLNIKIVI